jgi:hypothetical protein
MKICARELTTCGVHMEGEMIALNFLDQSGNDASLRLSFRQAQALSMTLPHLLTQALVAQTGDANARFVFPLGEWFLEDPKDGENFILTLKTDDGFKVSFAMTAKACATMGPALERASAQSEAVPHEIDRARGDVPRLN